MAQIVFAGALSWVLAQYDAVPVYVAVAIAMLTTTVLSRQLKAVVGDVRRKDHELRNDCNYCVLEAVKRSAAQNGSLVSYRGVPASSRLAYPVDGEMNYGTDVLVGGLFLVWLWDIPKKCMCREIGYKDKPIGISVRHL